MANAFGVSQLKLTHYREKDMVAVVDLGNMQKVSRVGAGFLQDIGSWIWFPRRLEIELSLDGKNLRPSLLWKTTQPTRAMA